MTHRNFRKQRVNPQCLLNLKYMNQASFKFKKHGTPLKVVSVHLPGILNLLLLLVV